MFFGEVEYKLIEETDVAILFAIPSINLNKRSREVLLIRCCDNNNNNTSHVLTLNSATD